jgi:hypothetical protein
MYCKHIPQAVYSTCLELEQLVNLLNLVSIYLLKSFVNNGWRFVLKHRSVLSILNTGPTNLTYYRPLAIQVRYFQVEILVMVCWGT